MEKPSAAPGKIYFQVGEPAGCQMVDFSENKAAFNMYSALDSSVPQFKVFLKEVALLFGLEFRSDIYIYTVLSTEEKVLVDFLGGCPAEPHCHWGDDIAVRQCRLKNFIESDDFAQYCTGRISGGSVVSLGVRPLLQACLASLKLPQWVKSLHDKLDHLNGHDESFMVIICVNDFNEATLKRMSNLLVHEWLHLLFFSNGVKFQNFMKNDSSAWLLDEGLATWVEARFATGKWDNRQLMEEKFHFLKEKGAPPTVTGYYEKGAWFSEIFCSLPKEQWADKLRGLLQ